jgi:deoxyribodipyrimidine photo-lyase
MLNIFWFRRDLRLHDNPALHHALNQDLPVVPVFIFDLDILSRLSDPADVRISFIHKEISRIKSELESIGSSLLVMYGKPEEVFDRISGDYKINRVYANHDYEPYARDRDQRVHILLKKKGIDFQTFKEQVIFEKDEVVKPDGKPYTVFTPYSRKWKERFRAYPPEIPDSRPLFTKFHRGSPFRMPSLEEIGFSDPGIIIPSRTEGLSRIPDYSRDRDFPGREGTTRLGVHLRFGTVSIRELAILASRGNETFLNELIWREFYMMILWHFPHVAVSAFKPDYDRIAWRNDEREFQAWCEGRTGYPIVDAGMRQLNLTGYMHNRVRMITASFLTKHLLIDWRWGEAYFASRLLDFELSSNNGGWQWAAGTGCDAAPYFRVFNPQLQEKKFDPEQKYIRKYVPELFHGTYPKPLVDHSFARNRAISAYKSALNKPG